MASKKQLAYQADWERRNIRRYTVKINTQKEKDLAEWMETKENIQGYLKSLIEADMRAHRNDVTVTFEGKTYTLTQLPFYNNGNPGVYQADAVLNGEHYTVFWEIISEDAQEEEDMCDWTAPCAVEPM